MTGPEPSPIPDDAAERFRHLPPQTPGDATVAHQLLEENPFGGPAGGGGDAVDADGD